MINNLLSEIDGYLMQLVYLQDLMMVEDHLLRLNKKMQDSPNFTLIVNCALIDSYTVTFMKLYDKSNKAKIIPNLIKKCKENIELFSSNSDVFDKLCKFEARLNEDEYIKEAIDILRVRRDSLYAHNDGKYFGVKIQREKSYLPRYKLCHLRDFTEEVLVFLFTQLTHSEPRKSKYDNDLENLLKIS